MGGEVHNGIAAAENGSEFRGISDISSDEFESFRQLAVAGGKIVVDDDVVSFSPKNMGSVTADVSGSPNDQNGQRFLPEDLS
jgi:hypothetical protein